MWWLFQKKEEQEGLIKYAYSRESRDLDGIVVFDLSRDEIRVEAPCAADQDKPKAQEHAIEKAYLIQREGFPDKRFIACG